MLNLKTKHIFGYPQDYLKLFYCDNYENITLKEFLAEIEKLTDSKTFSTDPDRDAESKRVFKGDIWEVFSEVFFNVFQAHPAFGIREYMPIDLSDDYGVDATGKNVNGLPCVVQCKYRKNPKEEIAYDEMAKTVAAGHCHYGFDLTKAGTIYLFTSAYDVNYAVKNICKSALVVLDREHIAKMVDGNKNFWQSIFESIRASLNTPLKA